MGAANRKQGQKPFTVFHVRLEQPEEILVDAVMAEDIEEAQRIATEFGKRTVLHVRPLGDASPPDKDKGLREIPPRAIHHKSDAPPPSARFIKGKFLPASSDEETLYEIAPD